MTAKLIIIRGNSCSGKTTTARCLQKRFEPGKALLVSQDVVRIEMLQVKDRPSNLAIQLIEDIVRFGKNHSDIVILEGILPSKIYNEMVVRLIDLFENQTYSYYFDLPFEVTQKRFQQSNKIEKFEEEKLSQWWLEKDYLNLSAEHCFDELDTEEFCVEKILSDVGYEE